MASQLTDKTRVDLFVDEAPPDTCLHIPSGALPGVDLPARLIIEGPDGYRRLVGQKRIGGAETETSIRVSSGLLGAIAPRESARIELEAKVWKASFWDVVIYLSGDVALKIVVAVAVLIAAVGGGTVALATRNISLPVALLVFVAGLVAAVLTAFSAIRDLLKPSC